MSNLPYPLINGVRHSWCSIEITLNGFIYLGVTSLNYDWELKHENVYGTHPDPLGRTRGQANYTGEVEMLLAEWALFSAALGPGFAEVPFQIDVCYSDNGVDTIYDKLVGCVLDKGSGSQSNGDAKAITRKLTIHPLKIYLDGLDPLLIPLTGLPLP